MLGAIIQEDPTTFVKEYLVDCLINNEGGITSQEIEVCGQHTSTIVRGTFEGKAFEIIIREAC